MSLAVQLHIFYIYLLKKHKALASFAIKDEY